MMRDSSNYLEKEYISIKEWCQMKFPLIFILDFTNHLRYAIYGNLGIKN